MKNVELAEQYKEILTCVNIPKKTTEHGLLFFFLRYYSMYITRYFEVSLFVLLGRLQVNETSLFFNQKLFTFFFSIFP